MASITLTWEQFEEIRKNLEVVHVAKAMDADNGEAKNTVVESEWDVDGVKITINLN